MNDSPIRDHGAIDPTLGLMLDDDARKFLAGLAPDPLSGARRMPRMRPSDAEASGWFQGMTVRPGFSFVMTDVYRARSKEAMFVSDDHLKLHFKLDGPSAISGASRENMTVEPGVMAFLVQPPRTVKYETVREDARMRCITMVCSREFAGQFLSPVDGDLPAPIVEYLKGPVSRFAHGYIPLPPQLRALVEEMMALQGDSLGQLMLEAKALELLYLALRQLSGTSAAAPRERDRRKVQQLCALLDSKEGGAMNIAQLCREIAWNETQMMESFKQITGTTIASYRQRQRMEQALRQLRTTELSITEIAFDAGYEHPSNFATAFKRTFGFSPRAGRASLN
ncbi:helix-turn-helix transcriptional regulator [Rhizorhabdus wittichii]|uniref:Helix-turn-helix transcriptional regulator n=1 Tax=Rhizorhabdus wittichii TaxID=160791 RepID=A0A975D156_9SPHN|nr:AraC family transcriptional regulator [Rhizorhabdus wittichii]QTH21007.1 helix-turn-helix transcriptional regulator [Rhizorhabdus wittichii]